jgi:hypothetical protein
LYRTDNLDVSPEVFPLEFLMLFPPHGGTRGAYVRKQVGKSCEFIRKDPTPDDSRIVVTEVADGKRCSRTDIVEDVLLKQAKRPGIRVSLKVSPHPIIPVADPGGIVFRR